MTRVLLAAALVVALAASAIARPSPFERDVYGQRGAAVPPQTSEATTDYQPPRDTAFAPSSRRGGSRTLLAAANDDNYAGKDYAGDDYANDVKAVTPDTPDPPVEVYDPERDIENNYPPIIEFKAGSPAPADGDASSGEEHKGHTAHKHVNPKIPAPCREFVEAGLVSGCVRYTVHHHETLRSLARALGIHTDLLRQINPQLKPRKWHVHVGWVINVPMGLAPPPMSRRDFADTFGPEASEETFAPRTAPRGAGAPNTSHEKKHHHHSPKGSPADSDIPVDWYKKKGLAPRAAPIFDRLPEPVTDHPVKFHPINFLPVDEPTTPVFWGNAAAAAPTDADDSLAYESSSPPPASRYVRPQNAAPDRFGFNTPAQPVIPEGQSGSGEKRELP